MRAVLVFCLLFSMEALAAWDSVAVFHRQEKVIVLINEDGQKGLPTSRLQNFIDLFKDTDSIRFLSESTGIRISCGRDLEVSSCTFRFTPGSNTLIEERAVSAHLSLNEFSNLRMDIEFEGFEVSFLNSNGDRFRLWVDDQVMYFAGRKK